MQIQTDGLVIGEQNIGENDRLVTLLTRKHGLIRAFAPRAKQLRSAKAAATQLLCYGEFSIYVGKNKYVINEAHALTVFFDLRTDLLKLSLGQYFCELAGVLAPEGLEAEELLRLVLNALHFLSKGEKPVRLLKPVVEMRMLALSGFQPNLLACQHCGQYETSPMYFLPGKGILYCKDCEKQITESAIAMEIGVLTALRHTIYADFPKLFSFSLQPAGLLQLSEIAETYLRYCVDKRLPTLEFFHQMEALEEAT